MRNNIFLILIGAILTAVVAFSSNYYFNIFVSIFGIIFVSIWIKVNIISKYYLDRWKSILKEFEKDSKIKVFEMLDQLNRTHPIACSYEASTTYMRKVLYLLGIIWCLILAYNITQLGSEIFLKMLSNQ
jgi:hypothetical protein